MEGHIEKFIATGGRKYYNVFYRVFHI